MKAYVLYDGRAEYDTDRASVLEFVGHTRKSIKDAIYFWRGHDAVLVEYDSDGGILTNEKVIGHIKLGWRGLKDLIASPQIQRSHNEGVTPCVT